MFVTIAGQNYTPYVSSAEMDVTISDPTPTARVVYDDIGSQLPINDVESEVILWDESVPAIGGIEMMPSVNLVLDPIFAQGGAQYTVSGDSPSIVTFSIPSANAQIVFSNTAGSSFFYQNSLDDDVVPGVSYMLSAYVTGSGSPTNIAYFIQINWLDGSGNYISNVNAGFVSPPTTRTRVNCSGVAPANTMTAQVLLAGNDTSGSGTNSGTITYDSLQLEPMWFLGQTLTDGTPISYPTPDCNYNQPTSVVLPDGTTSRKCRIFTGVIKIAHMAGYTGKDRSWEIDCNGLQDLLINGALVDRVYTNQTDKYIINDIITNYYSGLISTGQMNLSAPPSTIQSGFTVPTQSWVDQTLHEILNTLAEETGFDYFVDAYGYLHYNDIPYDFAPFTVSRDASTYDYITVWPPEEWKYDRDGSQLRNNVKVIGGTLQTTVHEEFNGDGATKKFGLGFVPDSLTNITIGGAVYAPTKTNKFGIAGQDVNGATTVVGGVTTTIVALMDAGNQSVTFNTAPASGTGNIIIEYMTTRTVSVVSQEVTSTANYRPFWAKVTDSTLTSTQTADLRGLSELQKWANPVLNPYFTLTQEVGAGASALVYPGTSIYLQSAADNINNLALPVVQLTATFDKGGLNKYQYECGTYRATFRSHVRNTQKALGRSTGVNGTTTVLEYHGVIQDNFQLSDSATATFATATTAVWSTAVYGLSTFA